MREELQYAARRVFAEFIDAFEKHHGQRGWMLSIEEEDLGRMGLTRGQVEGALDLLVNEDLIEAVTFEHHELTDLGYRACVHRALIDDVLGSPAASRGSGMLVIQAQQVVIGNNNTLQANSDEVIAKLIEHIKSSSVPDATKSRWVETLKDVSGYAIAEGLKLLIEAGVG